VHLFQTLVALCVHYRVLAVKASNQQDHLVTDLTKQYQQGQYGRELTTKQATVQNMTTVQYSILDPSHAERVSWMRHHLHQQDCMGLLISEKQLLLELLLMQ
jgi:hypothetical protein